MIARLQRMEFEDYGGSIEYVCLVNEVQMGGEFTLCGCAIPDSTLDREGFARAGKSFYGTIKDVTCPNCKRVLEYIKNLE